jgi:hypothetical protein
MNDLIKMTCVVLQNNTTQNQMAVTITVKGAFHNMKIPSYYVAVGTDSVSYSVLYNKLC